MQRNIEWSLRIGLLGAERKMSVRATSNRKWHLMTARIISISMACIISVTPGSW